jgi:hypothetical protein
MKTVFVVYKTDAWHSYSSRDIIGICKNADMAIKICKEKAKKEFRKIDKEQLFNLQNIKQTQGYSGEGEFQFEEMETNVLL